MRRISESIIEGTRTGNCWHCSTETVNISITFETYMCSEKCDNKKFAEYMKACGEESE